MEMNRESLPSMTFPAKPQILIVEDDFIIAANLQENLESLGYNVIDRLDSAEAAIQQAAKLHPDVVLMDIRLQGELDGIQAAEFIWDQLQIPLIYVTGHSDRSTMARARKTYPFGYILKPVKGPELQVAIARAWTVAKKLKAMDENAWTPLSSPSV